MLQINGAYESMKPYKILLRICPTDKRGLRQKCRKGMTKMSQGGRQKCRKGLRQKCRIEYYKKEILQERNIHTYAHTRMREIKWKI